MIKVLHFVSTPGIGSGVMSVIMNYYRHIDRSRVQFDFLCFIPCEESYEREIHALGGQVYFVPKPGPSLRSLRALSDFFRIHTGEYQWFHNHEVYLSFLLKPLAAHYGLNAFIVHCHATRYSDRPSAALRNRITCIPITHMNCARFACSFAAGEFLYGKKASGKQAFQVMPNAVDKKVFRYNPDIRRQCRMELNLQGRFVILQVGRFTPQKNHIFLLKTFFKISEKIPDARLLLVGDGPLKESCMLETHHLEIADKVMFLGQCDNVPELMQAADLFVLPSVYEGFPVSCLEAQAAGLTCLIADTVTDEVRLNENVHLISLKSSVDWLRACQNAYRLFLEMPSEEDRRCPDTFPDIYKEAAKLADFYEKRSG